MGWIALAYHNAQLEASAFREEFDNEAFEDLTEPKIDMMHKVYAFVFPS
jgi:ATP-dependent DNA helicase 2 subunit 1